jgi:hypothetical protein
VSKALTRTMYKLHIPISATNMINYFTCIEHPMYTTGRASALCEIWFGPHKTWLGLDFVGPHKTWSLCSHGVHRLQINNKIIMINYCRSNEQPMYITEQASTLFEVWSGPHKPGLKLETCWPPKTWSHQLWCEPSVVAMEMENRASKV